MHCHVYQKHRGGKRILIAKPGWIFAKSACWKKPKKPACWKIQKRHVAKPVRVKNNKIKIETA